MKFVADESIDRQIVERLRLDGHEVFYVTELYSGIRDDEVLELANAQEAVLMTADKDFGELIFRLRKISGGVMLIRMSGLSPEEKARKVSSMINEHSTTLASTFSVLSPGTIRFRPRLI